jgi:hypothetical protein
MPLRGAISLDEPSRRDAGNSMMVPISNSSLCVPLSRDLAGDMPPLKSGRS